MQPGLRKPSLSPRPTIAEVPGEWPATTAAIIMNVEVPPPRPPLRYHTSEKTICFLCFVVSMVIRKVVWKLEDPAVLARERQQREQEQVKYDPATTRVLSRSLSLSILTLSSWTA